MEWTWDGRPSRPPSGPGLGPKDVELFENFANCMDQDYVLFGNLKWLENFKEMKLATIDPLYKDYPKLWLALCFNLQLVMMKGRHGWFDTSFKKLLLMLLTQGARQYLSSEEDDLASDDEA